MLDLSKNYFELFALPVKFNIDSEQLSGRYRQLQQVMHPDRYANASEQERRLSMQYVTQINEAYQTLKNPSKRASYMLSLQGIDLDLQRETSDDAVFLMEQLELRESLEQAQHANEPMGAVKAIMNDVRKRMQLLTQEMSYQFEDSSQEALERARETLRKMQFLEKLCHEAESLEAELDEGI